MKRKYQMMMMIPRLMLMSASLSVFIFQRQMMIEGKLRRNESNFTIDCAGQVVTELQRTASFG